MQLRVPALGLLLGVLLLACGPQAEPRPTPNVVLVSVDTLRADATSPYAGPLPTPALQRLADGGALFERAFSPSAETAPSHATLFTGQEVLRHGVVRNGIPLAPERRTLAEALRDRGYATAAFVSSWVLDPRFGWDQGFERYDARFPEEGATMDKRRNTYPGALWREHEFAGLDRRAEITTAAAAEWLREAPEPFFAFVHFFDPHGPYTPPQAYWPRIRRLSFDVSDRSYSRYAPSQVQDLIRLYHGEVAYVDDGVAALVEALAARSPQRPTLVVFTADHGEGLGQRGWMEHGVYLYDEAVHVPLLFHWLGSEAPARRLATPVGIVDVAPTLAALTGVPLADADGRSLAASLERGAEPEPLPIFAHRREFRGAVYPGPPGTKLSVRSDGWKLIRNADAEDELYDLASDPGETSNLLAERSARARSLDALLDAHLEAMPSPAAAAELPEEVRRRLEALGYSD